ncbi:MAG: cytochrome c [Betaproteobacteria bacterium]|nr:cytochrome c [Betaproteobacteria bacterium]
MKKLLTLAAAALVGGALAGNALAGGDPAAGKAKAAQVCAACHSADGAKPTTPAYPILAGQYDDYLIEALHDYKSGKRKNAIMNGMAAGLSDADIDNLAAWFSSQHSALHTPVVPLHFE